jgi:hypothetical protein
MRINYKCFYHLNRRERSKQDKTFTNLKDASVVYPYEGRVGMPKQLSII